MPYEHHLLRVNIFQSYYCYLCQGGNVIVVVGPIAKPEGPLFSAEFVCLCVCLSLTGTSTLQR